MSDKCEAKPTSSFPKFENLEGLIKERESLKQIVSFAQDRIQTIEATLEESIKKLQEALCNEFSPPPSSDSDVQLAITKLGTWMKTVTQPPGNLTKVIPISSGNNGKVVDSSPEPQLKAIDALVTNK